MVSIFRVIIAIIIVFIIIIIVIIIYNDKYYFLFFSPLSEHNQYCNRQCHLLMEMSVNVVVVVVVNSYQFNSAV